MGGNNTFASGKVVDYRWRTAGKIHGVKVLQILSGQQKLPEEAHNSNMYIKLNNKGIFYQLRIYDKNHRLRFELSYHREKSLDDSGQPVLHYHIYRHPGFRHGPPHLATAAMKKKFKKYMPGVNVE